MQTIVYSLTLLLCLALTGPSASTPETTLMGLEKLQNTEVLCSSAATLEPKCTGSVYCSACKNCKYCAHCSRGGSCGVCGKRATKKRVAPKTKKKKTKSSQGKSSYQPREKKNSSESNQKNATKKSVQYIITKSTQMRKSPNSSAKILKALNKDDTVTVIDTSGSYWWFVQYKDWEGWVKKVYLKKLVLP